MRKMKQQVQSILINSGSADAASNYDAFNIEDQCCEKQIVKVKFTDNDNIFKTGKLMIKNRIKSFDIFVNATKADKKDAKASFFI